MTVRTSLQIGLTGGIASGKSTVGRFMSDMGCFVTDADKLVAELYGPDEAGTLAVVEAFGEALLNEHGGVDKSTLSNLVFDDAKKRKRLEQMIHPLVAQRFAERARAVEGLVVFEATLLVEGGGHRRFDRLVTVEANPSVRLERAVARGLSSEQARSRMSAQAGEDERVAAAHFVIRNDGTLADLKANTAEVVAHLRSELKTSSSSST